MSKIWLDVSTILHWQRPAVGVVRVEAECVKFALSQADEAYHFCRFDSTRGFSEVSAADVRAALSRISASERREPVATAKQSMPLLSASGHRNWEQYVRHSALQVINKLPGRLRQPVFNFIRARKPSFKAALQGVREFRTAIKAFFRPVQDGTPEQLVPAAPLKRPLHGALAEVLPFSRHDVYLSMGADWNHGDLSHLYSLKKRHEFKVVLFCYDIIPIKFPHLTLDWVAEVFVRYFYNIAWCADEVLCISECSRNDLRVFLTELGTPIPPMSVVRLGCQLPAAAADSISPDVTQLRAVRYILFVSTIERRKNHETLYRAYTRLVDQGEKDLPLLVFVGMPGWGVNDFMADLRLDPRTAKLIKVLNHVTDAELGALYESAYFTVYPSLYEGWGLPVAESLAAGKFCLASGTASIPEIGGDLIEYIDPWDVPKWAERLRWYSRNPWDVVERSKKIQAEYQPTQWHQTGAEIVSCALRLSQSGHGHAPEKAA